MKQIFFKTHFRGGERFYKKIQKNMISRHSYESQSPLTNIEFLMLSTIVRILIRNFRYV